MVGYILAVLAFLVALFGHVNDVQFVALLIFSGVCVHAGSRMIKYILCMTPRSERKS